MPSGYEAKVVHWAGHDYWRTWFLEASATGTCSRPDSRVNSGANSS